MRHSTVYYNMVFGIIAIVCFISGFWVLGWTCNGIMWGITLGDLLK